MRRPLINYALALRIKPSAKLIARLHEKITICPLSGCWIWGGFADANGYGQVKVAGKAVGVHRACFALYKRPIKAGQEIDHICHNHSCCNPAHLRESSHRTNSSRGRLRRKYKFDDVPF